MTTAVSSVLGSISLNGTCRRAKVRSRRSSCRARVDTGTPTSALYKEGRCQCRSKYDPVRGGHAAPEQLWLEQLSQELLARHDTVWHRIRPGKRSSDRGGGILFLTERLVLLP